MAQVLNERELKITDRQREVVELIAEGLSNNEVGERLGISPRTAKAHCDVLRQKLGVTPSAADPSRLSAADRRRPARTKPRIRSLRIRGLTALYLRPGAGTGPLSTSRYFAPPRLRLRPQGMVGEATTASAVSPRRIIKRPRLTRMLDESGARIILLVAPAGYGKTTLAHEWLEGKSAAWYRGSPARRMSPRSRRPRERRWRDHPERG